MNILAIDPARSTGFCYGPSPDALTFGVWTLGAHRLADLERYLTRALEAFPDCQVIAYEIAALGAKGFHAVHAHAELAGKIKEVADRRGLKCWGFHIGTWKSRAIGSGRAKPVQYKKLIELHYGIRTTSADEAAAIGIWHAAQHGQPVPKKKQAKAVKKALKAKQRVLRFG